MKTVVVLIHGSFICRNYYEMEKKKNMVGMKYLIFEKSCFVKL